ncbi:MULTISPECIES: hypothetical protein [Burkholderia]|uniref:hypothetical protein n=1 Tax=Burkholderia TaxID=32008 RepID=UPI00103C5774|nr:MULTISPECIES: hypothetical protein [Burkholderia]
MTIAVPAKPLRCRRRLRITIAAKSPTDRCGSGSIDEPGSTSSGCTSEPPALRALPGVNASAGIAAIALLSNPQKRRQRTPHRKRLDRTVSDAHFSKA